MILRHLLSILLLPFVVTVVLPRWLLRAFAGIDTRWSADSPATWLARMGGMLLLAAGLALFGWCVLLFARHGKGTLAPWDPTRRFVAVGPYRRMRNPMIAGVLLILLAEAALLGSLVLSGWAVAFLLINHIYFLLVEEPGLEKRFGESYREYRAHVPRWLPRSSPWSPDPPGSHQD